MDFLGPPGPFLHGMLEHLRFCTQPLVEHIQWQRPWAQLRQCLALIFTRSFGIVGGSKSFSSSSSFIHRARQISLSHPKPKEACLPLDPSCLRLRSGIKYRKIYFLWVESATDYFMDIYFTSVFFSNSAFLLLFPWNKTTRSILKKKTPINYLYSFFPSS